MDQKTMAIVVIVIVIVAVVGVGAYWALTSGGGNGGDETPTGVADATSLQYSVEITGGESEGTYNFYAKNIGTDDMMIRIEIPLGDDMEFTYIVNGAEQKAWSNEGSGWVDLSDTFSDQWDLWDPTWQAYTDNLASWTSGDWTYTDTDGSTVTITGITVNPSLADSLFQAET